MLGPSLLKKKNESSPSPTPWDAGSEFWGRNINFLNILVLRPNCKMEFFVEFANR